MGQRASGESFTEPQTARTITARNITQAYVFNSARQRRRIAIYGKLNSSFLRSLMPLKRVKRPAK